MIRATMDSALDLPGAPRMRLELRHCDPSLISASSWRRTSAEAKLPNNPGHQKTSAPAQDHTSQTGRLGTCWSQPSPISPLPTRLSPDPPTLLRRPRPGRPGSNPGLGRLGHQAEPWRLTAAIPLPFPRRRGGSNRGRGRNHKGNNGASGPRCPAACRIDRRYCSPPPAPSRRALGCVGPGNTQAASPQLLASWSGPAQRAPPGCTTTAAPPPTPGAPCHSRRPPEPARRPRASADRHSRRRTSHRSGSASLRRRW
mmetsp:Transcript_98149/g.262127  ORF Transcript_98149/g.262127 Transcript_98149/m.262127 type:complete len:256 (+) Transcript_98149:694-1461(+)